jgi:hypothetical protein
MLINKSENGNGTGRQTGTTPQATMLNDDALCPSKFTTHIHPYNTGQNTYSPLLHSIVKKSVIHKQVSLTNRM